MVEKYSSSKFIVLAYHGNDELANPRTESRAKWYNARGFPTVKFDGVKTQGGGWDEVQTAYENIIESRAEVSPLVSIALSGILGEASAQIKATVTPVMGTTKSNLQLRWVIYEDNVSVKGKLYRFVVREVLADDSLLFQGTQAVNITKTFSMNPTWKYSNLGVVAFVQDDSSKEVLQAAVFKLGK
ncbi:MAG: Omp28-related outer membrane protein [bacterium]|nr:Omp28-related outer membrane protein [bacterium]